MQRGAGILLHISSLPNNYGIGTLGKSAYEFIDFLKKSGQKYWQVLPLCQTGYGDSPYQSCSAISGNPYFIDLDILQSQGLLEQIDYSNIDFGQNEDRINYSKLFVERYKILRKAFNKFNKNSKKFKQFKEQGHFDDYALYMSLKYKFEQKIWCDWEDKYKYRLPMALEEYKANNGEDIDFYLFLQFTFFEQWQKLKAYANKQGIKIVGDIPIYVAYDSADVWANNHYFLLDKDLQPTLIAGCPPDPFAENGQLWGNPIYDWKYLKNHKYSWWKYRLYMASQIYDVTRIDHFRGFSRYYTIKNGSETAKHGEWKNCYGAGIFKEIEKDVPNIDILAEDLGFIDDKTRKMLKELKYPGMKILLFAFNGDADTCDHTPTVCGENNYVYTGTHDNQTILGFVNDSDCKFLKQFKKQLDNFNVELKTEHHTDIVNAFIELAYAMKPKVAIIPMQDILCQDDDARMNTPSTLSTLNWSYKLKNDDYKLNCERLNNLAKKYKR